MVTVGTWNDQPLVISLKPGCMTISIGEPDNAQVLSFDRAGRLWTAYINSISYRRGLDGRIVAKWRSGYGRQRRWLTPQEAAKLESQIHANIVALWGDLETGQARLKSPLPPEAASALQQIVDFDPAAARENAAQYQRVYKPIGILPPDQYMAVVVQITEGCSFNSCTFCDFYKDRLFHIKGPDELRMHALAVRDLLGQGLSLRRSVFLADANALVTPMHRLVPQIDVVREVLDVERIGGLYAFLDGFSGEKKSAEDYALLRERGLRRVYLGLESGNEVLLQFLKKPGSPQQAVNAVRAMKEGGLAVGVIVLLGAGGQAYAEGHVADTIQVVSEMGLNADDILYFSELIENEDLAYTRDAFDAGLSPLSDEERNEQSHRIRAGLRFSSAGGAPRISRYDIREFVY